MVGERGAGLSRHGQHDVLKGPRRHRLAEPAAALRLDQDRLGRRPATAAGEAVVQRHLGRQRLHLTVYTNHRPLTGFTRN